MTYEDTSLQELMDALRKDRAGDETPEEDFLIEEPDPFFQQPEIDIDQCIRTTLEALQTYRLKEEEQQTIREFLTFRLQTRRLKGKRWEINRAFYNLMLLCQEPETALRVGDILRDALQINRASTTIYTEQQAIQRCESKSRLPRSRDSFIPADTKLLMIYDCKEQPTMNLDGGSAVREKSRKEIEGYCQMWAAVCTHIRSNPETVLIVSGDKDAYRTSFLPNNELSRRLCAHHIHLTSLAPDQLFQDCLTELRNSAFQLEPGFEEALSSYFPAAYKASDLSGQAFVEDVVSKVYAQYFCRQRDGYTLTADCIPGDNPQLQTVEGIFQQMNELVGLQNVKEEFQNIYKLQLAGLTEPSTRYHMLFSGNPGTGKTTVARMAADLFYQMNIIKTNKLVITKPCDLVSEWIGGTGTKAMEVIRRAYNGVLFIDEAYGIATMDRGDELLNILLQEMENHADKLVVILAGYSDEMRELLKSNPGLASRIGREIHFNNYTQEELVQIFLLQSKKAGFSLHPSARDELEDCISALMTKEFFGNARDVQNMLQDLKEVWSDSYYKASLLGGEQPTVERVFLPEHFEKIMPPKKEVSINDLIGLDVLKQKLATFKKQATYQKYLREKGFSNLSDFSMHMIFTGNPGTGKTTVARLIADDLYSIGMLKTNRLVVAERKDLISAYGDTGKKTADLIRKAAGGVLFIDEAYSLADGRRGGPGSDAIEVFLTAMEEHKSDTVFIFAGYVDEMQDFLAMNPGIRSRIGYTFHFEDYSPAELTQMYAEKMHKSGFQVSADALDRVREIMEYFQDVKHFGNGRFVNHVIHQTISQRANRDFTKQYRDIHPEDIPSIKTLLETAPNNMHLYDPATITPEQQRRTALHELGHAIVMVDADPKNVPESISVRSHAGSLGRVTLPDNHGNRTEQELIDHIAALLGGKNAEKVCLGSHSTGCASDYIRAKRVAEDMIQQFAMTTFGATASELLKAADHRSMEIITRNKERLEALASVLLQEKELTGQEFVKALAE